MQAREMYEDIPGLKSPWTVAKVSLDVSRQQIVVYVEHPVRTKFCYPECTESLPCYECISGRQWRHLDSFQCQICLHARIPRVNCPEHWVKQVRVPRAEKGSRFTILLKRFAIQVLLTDRARKTLPALLFQGYSPPTSPRELYR
jgi:transposase